MSSEKIEHFTVEINENSEVFIYLEKESLEMMIADLQRLQKAGDHTHYMSEEWGCVSLSSAAFDTKNTMLSLIHI